MEQLFSPKKLDSAFCRSRYGCSCFLVFHKSPASCHFECDCMNCGREARQADLDVESSSLKTIHGYCFKPLNGQWCVLAAGGYEYTYQSHTTAFDPVLSVGEIFSTVQSRNGPFRYCPAIHDWGRIKRPESLGIREGEQVSRIRLCNLFTENQELQHS